MNINLGYVIGTITVLLAAVYLTLLGATAFYNKILRSELWRPIEAQPLVVMSTTASPGDKLFIVDGLCNSTSEPLSADIQLRMEGIRDDLPEGPSIGQIYKLVGTQDEPYQVTIFPGCIGTQPSSIDLSNDIEPGIYRLVLRGTITGEGGQVQEITEASEPFEVVDGGD